MLFIAALIALLGAVAFLLALLLTGKPICIFLALCLAVLAAIIIIQF